MATTSDIYSALIPIQDPELMLGIVALGLIYNVEVEGENGQNVTVTMTFTSPMCPVAPMIKQSVHDAVAAVPGVEKTDIDITFTPPWDPRTMANDDVKVLMGIW